MLIDNAITRESEEKLRAKKTASKLFGPAKFISFCEYLSPQVSDKEASGAVFRTMSDVGNQGLYTEAVDDTDVRVHCTDKARADQIIKEGVIRGRYTEGVSFTNKFGTFKGHTCNQGADVCFVFDKKDVDAQPVLYKWDSRHFDATRKAAVKKCMAGDDPDFYRRIGYAEDDCEAQVYHAERECNKLLTKKEAVARAKELKRDLGELEQSALFVYENEFRSRKKDVKLPEKYELVPNSCKLEIKPLASFAFSISNGKVVGIQ